MSGISVETNGEVASVILDRPPVNAITLETYRRMGDIFAELGKTLDINCVLLVSRSQKAFCAGLDLNEFLAATPAEDPMRAAIIRRAFAALRHCAVPVIGVINGPALGAGCVLSSLCDIRLAAPRATFGMPEINVGRCGAAAHMARHLPQGLLRKMYFTGKPIDAAEAYRHGFVQEIVPEEDLSRVATALAEEIAAKSPLGLRHAKIALNKVEFMQVEEGYEIEQLHSTILMHTADAREATRAAVEKRAPVFVGR